ncbi:MAG: DUF4369 domain-containing protein [Bacteroidales bacterium]|nr:DUF4369 domain-containing protein [Bacteroidales bacterium]
MRIFSFIMILAALVTVSCSRNDSRRFTLDGRTVNGRTSQVAYLYRYLPGYGKVQMLDSAAIEDGRFRFEGICDTEPVEAYVRFGGDDFIAAFVLTPGRFAMNAGKNGYYVSGNYESTRISRLVCLQNDVAIRRAELRSDYQSALADSTLTRAKSDSLFTAYRGLSRRLSDEASAAIADSTASAAFRSLARRLFYHATEVAATDTLR